MQNKLEKTINGFYCVQIILCAYYFIQIFVFDNVFNYNTIFLAFFFFPIFVILLIIYKKKHKNLISKDSKNQLTRKLKVVSIIIFITAITTLFVLLNLMNKNHITRYNEIYFSEIRVNVNIIRDISGLIYPYLLILFAINFYTIKDVNSRYQNLKNAVWVMFIFGFLIAFIGLFSQIIYDIELVAILKLFN